MTITIVNEPVPLAIDADGVVRVGGTRVTLDIIVDAFNEGATPEEIVLRYPVLSLADVYDVIGYYLRRRSEIEAYLSHQRKLADKARRENEARFNPEGVRKRLLARLADKQK
jgi:uncharacterized protein (DUF433 family)